MDKKLIDGHYQYVFSEEEQNDIIDLYISGKSIRYIMKKYNVAAKPIVRLLDQNNIEHTRGNLRAYASYYPEGIYDPSIEEKIALQIENCITPDRKNKYLIDKNFFNAIDTEEKAYILGFLYADGNNNLDKEQVTLSLEEQDRTILDKMNYLLKYNRPLSFKDYSQKKDFGYTYKNQYCLSIYNKQICSVLNLRGMFPNKSLILEFPKWLNPTLYKHFIRGYFDGDGSIYQRHFDNRTSVVVTITSTQKFCEAISDICAKYLKINSGIYDASCHNGVTKVFQLSGNNVCKKFLDWLYEDATIFLDRKYQRYINYFLLNEPLSA